VIRVEDLTIAGMTRSAGGTIAEPGRGVQAMAGLNRGILSGGWSATLTRLDQMAPGRVEKVNLGYTSQTRNAGKHLARESRNNQADFKSVACEHLDKADLFATRNITETAGTARPDVAAPGDRVRLARSVTSEPQLVAS
jgi:putative transposase